MRYGTLLPFSEKLTYKEIALLAKRVSRIRRDTDDDVRTAESVIQVYASVAGVEEPEKREVIEVRQFCTEPAYVRVSAGVTKNLGNYESLRVDVAINVPCYIEEIEAVQKRVAVMVSEMLTSEVEEYLGGQ